MLSITKHLHDKLPSWIFVGYYIENRDDTGDSLVHELKLKSTTVNLKLISFFRRKREEEEERLEKEKEEEEKRKEEERLEQERIEYENMKAEFEIEDEGEGRGVSKFY